MKYAKGAQFIFFLEAVAQCLPYWVFWPCLKGPYLSFIDNSSAQWALTKGYSNNEQANRLVTMFWCAVSERQGDPWFERVPTKANISDSVSRGDRKPAKTRGWIEVEVDLREVWNLRRGGERRLQHAPRNSHTSLQGGEVLEERALRGQLRSVAFTR